MDVVVKLKKNKNLQKKQLFKSFYLLVALLFLTGCISKKKSIFDDDQSSSKDYEIEEIVMQPIPLEEAAAKGFIVLPFSKDVKCLYEDGFAVCDFKITKQNKNNPESIMNSLIALYLKEGWSFTPILKGKNYLTISANKPEKTLSITIMKETKRNPEIKIHQSICLI